MTNTEAKPIDARPSRHNADRFGRARGPRAAHRRRATSRRRARRPSRSRRPNWCSRRPWSVCRRWPTGWRACGGWWSAKKAVVTPAARDLLQTTQYYDQPLGRCGGRQQAGAAPWRCAIRRRIRRHWCDWSRRWPRRSSDWQKPDWRRVVAELTDTVVKDGRLGLLLSGKPDVACCLANRRPGVRAAVARDRDEVAQAVGNLGVNLLVVDPARRSLFQLGQMVKQFLQAGPAQCPAGAERATW